MAGLDDRDLRILGFYAENGNRELYWNYLAQREGADGYGLLALGVVRNDSMPGAVANQFADNVARRDGARMDERSWERFGEDLVARDFALRSEYVRDGRPDLALNLPVNDVQRAHDGAFRQFGIDPNAWTPRQLLEAARRQGGDPAAEGVWQTMLDGRGLGLGRMGITSLDVMWTYNDAELPATRYLGALTGATALAAADRARTDPDVIGARDFYYLHDRRTGGWSSVSAGGMAGPVIREVTDPERLRELNDARAIRLESQRQRSDWHPDDPHRDQPIARSPFTLADAGTGPGARAEDGVRLAAADRGRGEPARDPPLLQQASAAIARRDAELGREPDESSRRIAVAGASLAARSGYERIDDIVFNLQTDRLAAGERFFVLQGGRGDPAHLRESMPTRNALALTPERMQQEVAQLDAVQARTRDALAQDDARRVQQPAGPQLA